jgi:F0F1-type ATP synthase delta subunit
VAEKWTGGEVRLAEVVDPEIIAGMIFRAGDRKLNRSLSHELEIMAARLLERASDQIQVQTSVEE